MTRNPDEDVPGGQKMHAHSVIRKHFDSRHALPFRQRINGLATRRHSAIVKGGVMQ